MEEFINDLVEHYNEIDTSDLQGIVMAKCLEKSKDIKQAMEQSDKIIYEIEKRVGGNNV